MGEEVSELKLLVRVIMLCCTQFLRTEFVCLVLCVVLNVFRFRDFEPNYIFAPLQYPRL